MQNLNFVPEWYQASLRRKNDLLVQVGAVLLLAAAMVVWWTHNAAGVQSARKSVAIARASLAVQEISWQELHELNRLIQERDRKQALAIGICGGASVTDILTELSHLMPSASVLTEISIAREDRLRGTALEDGVPPGSLAPPHPQAGDLWGDDFGSIEIDGLASGNTVVGEFHTELVHSPAFAHVEMKYSRPVEFDARKARRFRFECRLPRFE
jgi:hypothetical protein